MGINCQFYPLPSSEAGDTSHLFSPELISVLPPTPPPLGLILMVYPTSPLVDWMLILPSPPLPTGLDADAVLHHSSPQLDADTASHPSSPGLVLMLGETLVVLKELHYRLKP